MTTLAYKDGVVVTDGRVGADGQIVYDDYCKRIVSGNRQYFMTGPTCDYRALVAVDQGAKLAEGVKNEAGAMIWDGEQLWEAAFSEGTEYWRCPKRLDQPWAMGSGSHYALTALDMGADAKTAVKMAAKRDMYTGGKIRTYKLKQQRKG